MKKIKYFTVIVIFMGVLNFADAQDLKIFKGTVNYQFNLSRTDKIPKNERDTIQKQLGVFIQNIELLIDYYENLNIGDTSSANKTLKQDTMFYKMSKFSLAFNFSLARMYQLGILYKPCIQINDKYQENNLIFCSEKQFEDLIRFKNKKFKLECKYIGNLIIDKTQAYELVNIK